MTNPIERARDFAWQRFTRREGLCHSECTDFECVCRTNFNEEFNIILAALAEEGLCIVKDTEWQKRKRALKEVGL